MKLRRRLSLKLLLLLGGCFIARAEEIPMPHELTVNMLYNTGQVFLSRFHSIGRSDSSPRELSVYRDQQTTSHIRMDDCLFEKQHRSIRLSVIDRVR